MLPMPLPVVELTARLLTGLLQPSSASSLLNNGTVAGVNATSSSYTFNIQGSAGLAPLNVASSSGTSLLTVLGTATSASGRRQLVVELSSKEVIQLVEIPL